MLEAMYDAASSITTVGNAVINGANSALSADAAAGNGQQLRVDLQALHDYFYKASEVRTQFKDAMRTVLSHGNPYESACIADSEITGVSMALQDTTTAALNTTDSMKSAFVAVDGALTKHLTAVAQTYLAYVNVDHEKSSELQAAGDSGAGDVAYGGGSIATQTAQTQQALTQLGAAVGAVAAAVTGA